MSNYLIFIFAIFLLSCQSKKETINIHGDLYYSWLRIGSFYGYPDSLYNKFVKERDSLGYEVLFQEDSGFVKILKILDDNDLLKNPMIHVKLDNNEVVWIYLDTLDYKQFTKFDHKKLVDNNQKVRIEAKTIHLYDNLYRCEELISVNKIEGVTLQKQKKFKIENYH